MTEPYDQAGEESAGSRCRYGPASPPDMNAVADRSYDVIVEVPRWGFVKRGSTAQVDFVSPLPCLYNYGAVPQFLGLDDDLLDAVILGPRLPVRGAVGLMDRGLYDDKLIFSETPLTARDRASLVRFFQRYALFKRLLNTLRGQPGATACTGLCDADTALARARPRHAGWRGPSIGF